MGVFIAVLVFFAVAGGVGAVAYFGYVKKMRRAKAIERGLKMVPILIHLPPPSSDTQGGNRDIREVMREKTAQAEVLYNLLAGTATEGFKSNFYGQRHIALELIVSGGLVHFFAAVPVALVSVVKKAIVTAYPGARLEEVEDHNIFNQEGRLAATLGGEMVLRTESAYPIATYEQLERDPMEAILTAVSALEKQDGVAVQIMLRPANQKWVQKSLMTAEKLRQGKHTDVKFTAMDLAKAAMKAPSVTREEDRMRNGGTDVSKLQLSQVERIEEKTKHPGFEVLVRVIVSTGSVMRSQQLLRDISTAFALYENPGLNGFKFLPALDVQGLVTAFIFRFFPNELSSNVLNSAELATLFHLPDSQFTPSTSVARQQSKQVDGPVQLPASGLLFGYNEFRDARKEIRLSPEDRRRHTYILGQTGTGKSTMLENLAVQDMLAGNGFAFIDPHGDSAEKLLALVPKNRAEDVVYFNPADTLHPLGLNLFEFTDPAQKDFLVQETINMLYKLYDPGHTGIIGPRYEHWYRNAALTLMADPNGATFIEIPKVFTDTEYLKNKFRYLKDPTVIDFWTKEMGQTSDYHKSEMLGWFVSKFGAFQNNEMMRNIIGQTKSSFNIREIMDQKKILIVNLSKGRIGELNSQLLGMIFVIKFQAAAMSRADMPEEQRADFGLYVDEFQNFSTDSFASILSEARKYHLNLIVANQFIGQLSNEIREAVFGNIGTIVAHRMGPDDAEFMVKQFTPAFDASDLVNIPNYHAAMRLMIGGLPSQPFTITDMAPLGAPNAELGVAVKQLSAAKYGHDKAVVEADLTQRLTGQTQGLNGAIVTPAPGTEPMAAMPAPAAAPASVPAPAVAAAAAVVPAAVAAAPAMTMAAAGPTPGLAMTPPPIGAPPVDLGAIAAPVAAPVATPVVEPAVVSAPPVDALQQAPEVVAQPSVQAAAPVAPAAPAGPQLSMTPPPIGAPPVDLPDPTKPGPVDTLSLNDITGQAVKPAEPEDPYAEIDVLGSAVKPPVQAAAAEEAAEELEVSILATQQPAADMTAEIPAASAAESQEPAVIEPAPTEPVVAEPAVAEPVVVEPAAAEASDDSTQPAGEADTFIKFVDPQAAKVLAGEVPSAAPIEDNNSIPSLEDLPEGIKIIADQAQATPSAVPPPVAEVAPAPAVEPVAAPAPVTTPQPEPVAVAPVMPAAPVLPVAPVPAAAAVMPAEATPLVAAAVPAMPISAVDVATVEAPAAAMAETASAPTDELQILPPPPGLIDAKARPLEPAAQAAPVSAAPIMPTAASSPIAKAEHEIDDLLSVSLIHPDNKSPRLVEPEPAAAASSAGEPAEAEEKSAMQHTSGMRVIQPLEPILPVKDQMAERLSQLQQQAAGEESAPSAQPTVAELAAAAAMPEVNAAVNVTAAAEPEASVIEPPAEVAAPAEAPVMEAQPEPEAQPEVQAQPEATLEPQPEVQIEAEGQPEVESQPEAEVQPEAETAPEPEPEPEPEPIVPEPVMPEATPLAAAAEVIEPEVPADQADSASAMPEATPGYTIMPSSIPMPADLTATPKSNKPAKKLAPGEVFVDDKGNVMIGE